MRTFFTFGVISMFVVQRAISCLVESMKICLNAEIYQKFLDHRLKESVGYSKLNNAVKIGSGIINKRDEYWIDCSEEEVEAVLTLVLELGHSQS